MDRFMVLGTTGPMQWMLDLRTYGMKIHYNTTAMGHINWKDQHVLEYKTLRFSMVQFRGMIHQLREATRMALFQDFSFTEKGEEIPSDL